jgi:hypothetical protein
LSAQQSAGSISGRIIDPTGAVILRARIFLTSPTGQTTATNSNREGVFQFQGLAQGKYSISVENAGFLPFTLADVNVEAGALQNIQVKLEIAVKQEKVQVLDESPNVGISPTDNASTMVFKGKNFDAFSDDPDELLSDLHALAGPLAGPNAAQIYIDGFTNGTLPPKNAIREIRINQSPFSAEYDRLGYGRVEVFTKPGTERFHSQLMFLANANVLNTVNPFFYSPSGIPAQVSDYLARDYIASFSGPLNKKSSIAFNLERRSIEDEAVVNAQTSLTNQIHQTVPLSRMRMNLSPRLDFQVTPSNTFTVRYQYLQDEQNDNGVGALVEKSQGYNLGNQEHVLQLSDTQVLGPRTLDEIRFQYIRSRLEKNAVSRAVGIVIPGADTSGGNAIFHSADLNNRLEFQNYLSMSRSNHLFNFGGRLRVSRESSLLVNNPSGTFTFNSISATIPSQYTLDVGPPLADLTFADAGLFLQDDWKLRPYFTLSYGLRYETQTNIHDKSDFAPRVGLSWGLGHKSAPPVVLRAGWGMFYERFPQSLVLQAIRNQQEYVVTNPACLAAYPAPPSLACSSSPTVYETAPNLASPSTSQTAISLERPLGKLGRLSVTYMNSRGIHQLLLDNINAPLDTSDPVSSRPDSARGNVYQYRSGGTFKQNQLIANGSIRAGTRLSLNAYYALSYASSNISGTVESPGFPSAQYNLSADYGRASFDVRHRLFVGGTLSLPWLIRLSPFMFANSGEPYNLTVGQDRNGDSIRNDRPGLVSTTTPYISPCGSGLFLDPAPSPGEKIVPRNCATGPTLVNVNLKVSKAFRIGKKGERSAQNSGFGGPAPAGGIGVSTPRGVGSSGLATSDGRYTLAVGATIHNLFNTVNAATPIGVVGSPFFGQSIALAAAPFSSSTSAANREIQLGVRFEF